MNSESSVILPPVQIRWASVVIHKVDSLLKMLPAQDRQRASEYSHADARAHFVHGRVLLRTMLAQEGSAFDGELSFGPHGKPIIEGGPSFNVSHSHGVVACAIHPFIALGIDVEAPWRDSDIDAIGSRFFDDAEFETLRQLVGDDHRNAFFELWTLKEALLKGTGKGLGTPLSSVTFRRGARWELDHELAQHWRLRQWTIDSGHLVAVAVEGDVAIEGPVRQAELQKKNE